MTCPIPATSEYAGGFTRLRNLREPFFYFVQPGVWIMNLFYRNSNTFHRQSLHFLLDTHGFGDGFLCFTLWAYMAQHHSVFFVVLSRLAVFSVLYKRGITTARDVVYAQKLLRNMNLQLFDQVPIPFNILSTQRTHDSCEGD